MPVTRTIIHALNSLKRPSSGSLNNVGERVVVNPKGTIIRVDLLPPFADLNDLSEKVSGCSGAASEDTAESQTSGKNAGCSNGSLAFWADKTHFEPRTSSEQTLEFTFTIGFPQGHRLRQLSVDGAGR
jgi:hypothetical protein